MSQSGAYGAGGGGGTVNSVSAGANISITGTATDPIVNVTDIIDLPDTNLAGTTGVYLFNSVKFMHNKGTLNTFLGADAGSLTLTSATENVGIGAGALSNLSTGNDNTCLGLLAGYLISTGSNNLILGSGSGATMSANASNNILINHPGVLLESNACRIGYTGSGAAQQNAMYLAATYNTNSGSSTRQMVYIDSNEQLGSFDTANHAIQLGNGGGTLSDLALGSANQVLQSGGGSADPAWSTATYPATTAQGDVLYSSSANTIVGLTKDANATRYISNTGASNNPAWAQIDLTNGVTGVLPIANGGTNASSMATTNGVAYFDGTRIVVTAAGTTGQVLTGNTGSAPTWGTASGGGITWNEVTGTSQSAAVNNGYICNNAGLVTVTLPSTAALGSVVRIAGKGAGGWKLAQNAGETIYFGTSTTTTGTGGYLASSAQYDSVEVVCITADNDWVVISSVGNITVV